jgi:hypothetical protein
VRDVDDVSSGHAVGPRAIDVDVPAINVDINAIDDFVALLRDEVTQNLRPYSDQIISEHRSGVGFGLYSGSEPMHALRQDYYQCLLSGAEGLRSYVDASEVLLAAAEKVAALYRRADAMAEAQSQDVLAALGASRREMNDSHKAAADTDALHETDRETRRAQR